MTEFPDKAAAGLRASLWTTRAEVNSSPGLQVLSSQPDPPKWVTAGHSQSLLMWLQGKHGGWGRKPCWCCPAGGTEHGGDKCGLTEEPRTIQSKKKLQIRIKQTSTTNQTRVDRQETDKLVKTERKAGGRDWGIQAHREQQVAAGTLSQVPSVSLGLGTGW